LQLASYGLTICGLYYLSV